MNNTHQPIVRTLKPDTPHHKIGMDVLTVSPADKYGNLYLFVIYNLFTKLVFLYPSPTRDALKAACALYQYFSLKVLERRLVL